MLAITTSVLLIFILAIAKCEDVTINVENDSTTFARSTNRIVGGTVVTNRTDFAYQVSLRTASTNSAFCGAAILNDRSLLTTAHCVVNSLGTVVSPSTISAVVGDLTINPSTSTTVTRLLKEIYIHEDFSYRTMQNDIALLKIDSIGPFNSYVNNINLATVIPAVGTNCIVSGWGTTSFIGPESNVLLYAEIPIVSQSKCSSIFGNALQSGMFCAGDTEVGGRGACLGDSGGPLVCDGNLVGVVSGGIDCGSPMFPDVFTDVSYYRNWINTTLASSEVAKNIAVNVNIESDPTSINSDTKIVGGDVVQNRADFPYQVSLRYTSSNFPFCGATILDDRNILTAAHCVVDGNGNAVRASTIKAVVGDLNVTTTIASTVSRTLKSIIVHENYNRNTFQNDIAILKVDSLGTFNAYVNNISLATSTPTANTYCLISGWGTTNSGGSASNVLRYAQVPIVSKITCSAAYAGLADILTGMLCAGDYYNGGVDSCQGDSGGPLVCNNRLAGIVSWGRDCARPYYPGVYTDVSYYRNWIQKNKSNTLLLNTYLMIVSLFIFMLRQ